MNNLRKLIQASQVDSEYGFELSADGNSIAFSSNVHGGWEIFELGMTAKDIPTQITDGIGGKFAPRYSPSGDKLAYACDPDGSENFKFHVFDKVSGKNQLLKVPSHLSLQPNCAWSPDGSQIAVMAIREDGNEIGLLNVDNGNYSTLVQLPGPPVDLAWSPDGCNLAVQVEAEGSNHAIALISLPSMNVRWLLDGDARLNAIHSAWSPDARQLAFSCDSQGFYDICTWDLESNGLRWLTNGKDEKTRPCWSADGRYMTFLVGKDCYTELATLDLNNSQLEALGLSTGVYHHPQFNPSSDKIFAIYEAPDQPPYLQEITFLKNSNSKYPVGVFQPSHFKNLVSPREITYPSPDSVDIPSLLFEPAGSDVCTLPPAVVIIHGGPDWYFQAGWNPLMSYLVGMGWLVLAPNYRGSTGYGKDWLNASRYQMGKMDCEDVMAGADYLVDQHLADPSRLAVIGRSHGGYLVMCCLTQRPALWRAGSAIVPVMNLFTSHEKSRQDLQHWNIQNYGDPVENKALWIERSPYFFLDRITSHLQIICGGRDVRCPPEDAYQAHLKLLELGKSSNFVQYPDEGHIFMKEENIIDANQRIVNFLQISFAPL